MSAYKSPSNLSTKTRAYLSKVYKFLDESGAYKDIDDCILDQLGMYYEAFSKYKEAVLKTGIVIEDVMGIAKDNPLNKKMNDCQVQLLKIQQELGLTPKSRERLTLERDKEDESPFKQLIERRLK